MKKNILILIVLTIFLSGCIKGVTPKNTIANGPTDTASDGASSSSSGKINAAISNVTVNSSKQLVVTGTDLDTITGLQFDENLLGIDAIDLAIISQNATEIIAELSNNLQQALNIEVATITTSLFGLILNNAEAAATIEFAFTIDDDAIVTAKIIDGAVTAAKIGAEALPAAPAIVTKTFLTSDGTTASWTGHTIDTAVTVTVLTAGGDYASLDLALAGLADYVITDNGSVTINITGTFVHNDDITISHPNADKISIVGPGITPDLQFAVTDKGIIIDGGKSLKLISNIQITQTGTPGTGTGISVTNKSYVKLDKIKITNYNTCLKVDGNSQVTYTGSVLGQNYLTCDDYGIYATNNSSVTPGTIGTDLMQIIITDTASPTHAVAAEYHSLVDVTKVDIVSGLHAFWADIHSTIIATQAVAGSTGISGKALHADNKSFITADQITINTATINNEETIYANNNSTIIASSIVSFTHTGAAPGVSPLFYANNQSSINLDTFPAPAAALNITVANVVQASNNSSISIQTGTLTFDSITTGSILYAENNSSINAYMSDITATSATTKIVYATNRSTINISGNGANGSITTGTAGVTLVYAIMGSMINATDVILTDGGLNSPVFVGLMHSFINADSADLAGITGGGTPYAPVEDTAGLVADGFSVIYDDGV